MKTPSKKIEELTDREISERTLFHMKRAADAVVFLKDLSIVSLILFGIAAMIIITSIL
ncbi:MAG: hypothetical protein MUC38_09690 [Cyclobacteriaceae bacterium]|jgi:hypothetical protein|nr:hypothetical protein [Cyclobacteriaceae bacterium]